MGDALTDVQPDGCKMEEVITSKFGLVLLADPQNPSSRSCSTFIITTCDCYNLVSFLKINKSLTPAQLVDTVTKYLMFTSSLIFY